jgi:hypothetical protein
MLLFGVISLMIGSTTSLLTCPGHGGYQATATKEYYTTPPPYYATKSTYATSTYYAEAPKCYTTKSQELRDRLCYPELQHQSASVLHHWVYCPSLLNRSPQVLHDYECCPSLLHRGSSLFQCQSGRVLHRPAQVPFYHEVHNHNWGGQVLHSPDLQTAAAPSYYVELKYYTEAPVYYITTYATPKYYDEVPN